VESDAGGNSVKADGEEVGTADNRDPNDPDYTPARYAIKAGEDGGKWNTLQSGETVYEYTISGEYARSVWVNDGGKLYYVDASGCKIRNNYAHDGFYAGADGLWDQSKRPISENTMPSERPYGDGSVTWTFDMDVAQNGTISGTALAGTADLGVVLVAQAADLVDLHAAGHQFGHNLGLAGAGLGFRGNEIDYLLVAHSLSACQQRHCRY
jgi:hypothetical protein